MHSLASPARFLRVSGKLLPPLAAVTVVLLVFGLIQALFISPADYQQGDSVRIMYVHVPAAWMSLLIYTTMAVASASFLIWKHPLADIAARESAPLGAAFTFITLATGSLWGKPMWGTWWEWHDVRMTSELVLFFLYIGYIALSDSYANQERGKKICAVLALVGFVNIPVIHFSVEWWNTLHQPASVVREGGPAIYMSMMVPLLALASAFTTFYLTILAMRVRTALIQQKIRRLQFLAH